MPNNIKQVEWIYLSWWSFPESQINMGWFFYPLHACVTVKQCHIQSYKYCSFWFFSPFGFLVFLPLLVFWIFCFQGLVFFQGILFFSGVCFSGVLVFWAINIIIWTLPPKADILDTHTRHPMKTGRRCQWKEFLPISIAPWEVIQHHK